ncbi:hypothetical protein STHU_12860 [Allostella humosa]|uniref:class I adenylate-forming enzyme family protein n=1 Tax=Stella humosa TaxID=94 RepID=UPI00113B087F|nr:class I adenylate-forming enzyme family protein [Stella humosa]BBK30652.1 hypothetical protein STHU_12860 [Stella humosa]
MENLVDPILALAAAGPDRPAIETEVETLSYAGLVDRMAAFAAGLAAAGLVPGDVVALAIREPAAMLVALSGAMLGGFAPIQLDPDSPAGEANRLFDLAQAGLLVGDWPGGDRARPATPFAQVLAAGAGAVAADMRQPGGERPAQINLSSGTTGLRKAVPIAHAQQLGRSRGVIGALGQGPGDRHLPLLQLHFAFGRQAAMRVLLSGGTVVALRLPTDIAGFVRLVERHAITHLEATPGHLRYLLDGIAPDGPLLLPGIRCLAVSTAMLRVGERKTVRRRLTPNLYITYGSNEMGVSACARPEDLDRALATIGRAMPGCEIAIFDETGLEVPAGAVGEIRVRTANAATRYLGDAAASDRSFREGWFRTGDAGRFDGDGLLFLTGRLDDRINFGGVKIYPVEIEDVLREHAGVADVAVVALPSVRSQQMPAAAIIGRGAVDVAALKDHCRARLGPRRSPQHIVLVEAFPLTGTGKVDGPALRQLLTERINGPGGA